MTNDKEETNYKKAKVIAINIELFATSVLEIDSKKVETFRKYLRDFSQGKQLITKFKDNKLTITRVK